MRVRKRFPWVIIIGFAILGVACSPTEPPPGSDLLLVLGRSDLSVGPGSGSQVVSVESNGSWQVTSASEWITVDPRNGNGNGNLQISYAKNDSSNPRSATVVVRRDVLERSIVVHQRGREAQQDCHLPPELILMSSSGIMGIGATCAGQWTASSSVDWITLSARQGSGSRPVEIWYEANTTAETRTGSIELICGGRRCQTAVTQVHLDTSSRVVIEPNPFGEAGTVVTYTIEVAGVVELHVFASNGDRVRTLVAGPHPMGTFQALWDTLDESGGFAASGIYQFQLEVDGKSIVIAKAVLIRE